MSKVLKIITIEDTEDKIDQQFECASVLLNQLIYFQREFFTKTATQTSFEEALLTDCTLSVTIGCRSEKNLLII